MQTWLYILSLFEESTLILKQLHEDTKYLNICISIRNAFDRIREYTHLKSTLMQKMLIDLM